MDPTPPVRPLIGRLEVYQALLRRRDTVLSGRGGISFLEGATGVGKSTFLDALAQESQLVDFRVFRGRAEAHATAPFQLVREAVRAAEKETVRWTTQDPTGSAFPYIPPTSSRSLPVLLGDGTDLPLARSRPLEAPLLVRTVGLGGSLEVERTRLMDELAAPLFAVADAAPVLLALEDVHWADEGSLEFLQHLAARIARRRVWVVATSLPFEEVEREARERFLRLLELDGGDRFFVRPLSEREVGDFIRWVDPGHPLERGSINRWYAQTSGNPLFLEQLLRAGAPDTTPATPEPARVDFAKQRIRTLSENERRILTIAAVLGKEARFSVLTGTTDENEEALAETVERLVREGLLRETANEVFEFVQEDLREELYQGLTETRRRILHRRVGEALEATRPKDIQSVYALARHFFLGRVDAKAVEYNRAAADYAAQTFLPGVALVHLERALEAHRRSRPDAVSEELDLLVDMVRQLRRLGELGRAEQTVRQVLDRPELLSVASDRQRDLLRLHLALIRSDQGRWEEAHRMAAELLTEKAKLVDPDVRMSALRFAGDLAYFRGDYSAAMRYHEGGLDLARGLGNEREALLETVRRARAATMLPPGPEAAIPVLRETGQRLEEVGEKAEASEAYLYAGIALGMTRDMEAALAEFERALRLAEEAGDPRRAGWALFDIADTMHDLHRLDAAEKFNRRAREILERVGDRFGLAQTYIYEGKIRRTLNDPDGAEKALRRALETFREQQMEADELEVLLRLAEVEASRGRWDAVREQLEELRRRGIAARRPDLTTDLDQLAAQLASQPV